MEFFVKMHPGKTITVDVDSFDAIASIKAKIEDSKGNPPDLQRQIIAGKLEGDLALAVYDIQKKSAFFLRLRPLRCPTQNFAKIEDKAMHIFVRVEGKTIALEVERSETIDNVMAKIQDKEGIPVYDQMLFFEETWLRKERTLGYYDIHEGCTVRLQLFSS